MFLFFSFYFIADSTKGQEKGTLLRDKPAAIFTTLLLLLQARFQWLLEAVDDDALSCPFMALSCGVVCEVQVEADDSLCRDLWVGWVLGRGPN